MSIIPRLTIGPCFTAPDKAGYCASSNGATPQQSCSQLGWGTLGDGNRKAKDIAPASSTVLKREGCTLRLLGVADAGSQA